MSNTAGYIDYVTVKDFLDLQLADPFRTFTDEELINYSVRDGKMNFAPGASQQYSHTDNVILGQVIQRATGQSMKELYDKNIFGPMGMKDTQFPVDQSIQSPVLHAFTMDRKFYEDCTYWNPFWGSTPGLPISNIHDLGKWGSILGTGRLISPAHFQDQIAPTSVGKGRNKPDLYFAYGFVVANGWISQNPSINGYSGAFGYNLATGVTIVVATTKSETTKTDASAFDILREVDQGRHSGHADQLLADSRGRSAAVRGRALDRQLNADRSQTSPGKLRRLSPQSGLVCSAMGITSSVLGGAGN